MWKQMKYLKQFSLYTFVGFFNAGISFLLMPYISHQINPAGYGILSMVNSFVTILIPLMGITATGIITIEYYKKGFQKEFRSLTSSILILPLFLGLFFGVVAVLFSPQIAFFLDLPKEKSYWIGLSVLIALFSIYAEVQSVYLIVEQKAALYVKLAISKFLLEIFLTILFISVFHMSWEGRLLSWLITSTIMLIASLIYFKKMDLLTLQIKKVYIMAGVNFGLPLILHTIGKFVINQSDRIFIAKLISIDQAGIYNIGYQIGMLILLLITALDNFYQPFLYERLSDRTLKGDIEIVRVTYIAIAGLVLVLVIMSALSPLLFRYYIDASYAEGQKFVFWIGLSYLFWGIYILFTGFIFYTKKTKILGHLAVLNLIVNLVLNYFLIVYFGALGAAYATCISFFMVAFIVTLIGGKMFNLPWFEYKLIMKK